MDESVCFSSFQLRGERTHIRQTLSVMQELGFLLEIQSACVAFGRTISFVAFDNGFTWF